MTDSQISTALFGSPASYRAWAASSNFEAARSSISEPGDEVGDLADCAVLTLPSDRARANIASTRMQAILCTATLQFN